MEPTNPNMRRTIPSGLVLGNAARGDLRWRNIACLLARPEYVVTRMAVDSTRLPFVSRGVEGARRRERVHAQWFSNRGRIVDSASSEWRTAEGRRDTYSTLPAPASPLALLCGRIWEKCSVRNARAASGALLISEPAAPPPLPPRSRCMKCLSVIVTRVGEREGGRETEIFAIFFLPSHAAPHNDFGARTAPDGRKGPGRLRGWQSPVISDTYRAN